MKSDDEDGIKKMLQRAGGCCEPVQFLNSCKSDFTQGISDWHKAQPF
jgi:hypothetical protein